jgi:hypothetical protein
MIDFEKIKPYSIVQGCFELLDFVQLFVIALVLLPFLADFELLANIFHHL